MISGACIPDDGARGCNNLIKWVTIGCSRWTAGKAKDARYLFAGKAEKVPAVAGRQNRVECKVAGAYQAQQLYQPFCRNRSARQVAHIVESLVALSVPGLLIA